MKLPKRPWLLSLKVRSRCGVFSPLETLPCCRRDPSSCWSTAKGCGCHFDKGFRHPSCDNHPDQFQSSECVQGRFHPPKPPPGARSPRRMPSTDLQFLRGGITSINQLKKGLFNWLSKAVEIGVELPRGMLETGRGSGHCMIMERGRHQ